MTIKNSTSEVFNEKYFPLSEWSHIPESDIDLLNSKINIMSQTLFIEEEVVIETVNIIKSHIDNYVITPDDKLELIKYIINN